MKTVNTISRYAAFSWLWKHDPEAKWFWFRAFIMGANLREDVAINLRDFGLTSKISPRQKHYLKIEPKHFIDVVAGKKTAEVRKNDRDFKNGDYLILKEYDKGIYSGSECVVMVTHTLHGGQYGIEKGFVVLSFMIIH